MRPWTAKQGQGHGSSLMAATLSLHNMFPVARRVLPPANAPHIFHNTTPRPLLAKFTEDCLPQKCWRKGHFLQPFGHPVTDLSAWITFYSASQLAGQDELLVWLGQCAQRFCDKTTGRMQSCIQWRLTVLHHHSNAKLYTVDTHCSTPPLQINHTKYPESHFTKRVKYLTVIISTSLHFSSGTFGNAVVITACFYQLL